MRENLTTIIFTVLVMGMMLLSGCATDTFSVGVPDTPTP